MSISWMRYSNNLLLYSHNDNKIAYNRLMEMSNIIGPRGKLLFL